MNVIETKNAPGAIGPYSQGYAFGDLVITSGFDKVVKTTCFLADMGDFAAFNEVYARYFTSKPARSCVAVRELPKGVLCEIEAIALK